MSQMEKQAVYLMHQMLKRLTEDRSVVVFHQTTMAIFAMSHLGPSLSLKRAQDFWKIMALDLINLSVFY